MNCLQCGREISESFFSSRSASPEFKGGRFACPHCGAEHIRRAVGQLPTGEPLYSFRLWGHAKSVKRTSSSPPAAGVERRRAVRTRPWR